MPTKVPDEEVITSVVLKVNAVLTGITLGVLSGLALFVATMWLVLRAGVNTGAHLRLLSQYFPGYTVTFIGSFVGFFYAFVIGFLSGLLIAAIYNKLAR